jgi:hypothetical protein
MENKEFGKHLLAQIIGKPIAPEVKRILRTRSKSVRVKPVKPSIG